MLPGIAALAGRAKGAVVTTLFLKAAGSVVVPVGITSARVTCIGAGGRGGYNDPDQYYYAGGGGALSQSVVAVTPGETLNALLEGANLFVSLRRASSVLVRAHNAENASPGQAVQGTGQGRFSGGEGATSFLRPLGLRGGGAAGSDGNGQEGGAGGARGAGIGFTQTSNGETAANADGATDAVDGSAYGGGGGYGRDGGPGIVIIEWGYGQ